MNKRILIVFAFTAVLLMLFVLPVSAKAEDAAPETPAASAAAESAHVFLNWNIEQTVSVVGGATVTIPLGSVGPGAQLHVEGISHMGAAPGPAGAEQFPITTVYEVKVLEGDGTPIGKLDGTGAICIQVTGSMLDQVKPGHSMYIARNWDPLSGDYLWEPMAFWYDRENSQMCVYTKYLNASFTVIEY